MASLPQNFHLNISRKTCINHDYFLSYFYSYVNTDVHLRLARCTSWVKQWSEAMDFLQTFFKTNIFFPRILDIYFIKGQTYHPSHPIVSNQKVCKKLRNLTHHMTLQLAIKRYAKKSDFDATYDPIVSNQKVCKKSPDFDTTYDPIVSNQKVCKKVQILTQIKAIY